MTSVPLAPTWYETTLAAILLGSDLPELRGPGIYIIREPITRTILYVGQSKDVYERLIHHAKHRWDGDTHRHQFVDEAIETNASAAYYWQVHAWMMPKDASEEWLHQVERAAIDMFDPFFNTNFATTY